MLLESIRHQKHLPTTHTHMSLLNSIRTSYVAVSHVPNLYCNLFISMDPRLQHRHCCSFFLLCFAPSSYNMQQNHSTQLLYYFSRNYVRVYREPAFCTFIVYICTNNTKVNYAFFPTSLLLVSG